MKFVELYTVMTSHARKRSRRIRRGVGTENNQSRRIGDFSNLDEDVSALNN